MPATVGGNTIGARTRGRRIFVRRAFPLASTHASGTPNTIQIKVERTDVQRERRIALREFDSVNFDSSVDHETLLNRATIGRIKIRVASQANPTIHGLILFFM